MSTLTAKISPLFPQTPFTPENESDEKELSQSLSSEYYSHARAREEAQREMIERRRREEIAGIPSYFCETFGAAAMPPVARREVEAALDAGLEPALIYTAMDEAAQAPRPSWAYARAILRRLVAENCFTEDDYAARQARHRARWQRTELPF